MGCQISICVIGVGYRVSVRVDHLFEQAFCFVSLLYSFRFGVVDIVCNREAGPIASEYKHIRSIQRLRLTNQAVTTVIEIEDLESVLILLTRSVVLGIIGVVLGTQIRVRDLYDVPVCIVIIGSRVSVPIGIGPQIPRRIPIHGYDQLTVRILGFDDLVRIVIPFFRLAAVAIRLGCHLLDIIINIRGRIPLIVGHRGHFVLVCPCNMAVDNRFSQCIRSIGDLCQESGSIVRVCIFHAIHRVSDAGQLTVQILIRDGSSDRVRDLGYRAVGIVGNQVHASDRIGNLRHFAVCIDCHADRVSDNIRDGYKISGRIENVHMAVLGRKREAAVRVCNKLVV